MALPDIPATDTVFGALRYATKATLFGLGLPGLEQIGRWYERKQLWDLGLKDKTPCVIIALGTVGIDPAAGAVEIDEFQFSIPVAFVAAGNYDTESGTGCQLSWTQSAMLRLHHRRDLRELALPAEWNQIDSVVVSPSEQFLVAAAKMGWDAQYLIVRYTVQHIRDLSDA